MCDACVDACLLISWFLPGLPSRALSTQRSNHPNCAAALYAKLYLLPLNVKELNTVAATASITLSCTISRIAAENGMTKTAPAALCGTMLRNCSTPRSSGVQPLAASSCLPRRRFAARLNGMRSARLPLQVTSPNDLCFNSYLGTSAAIRGFPAAEWAGLCRACCSGRLAASWKRQAARDRCANVCSTSAGGCDMKRREAT